MTMTLSESRSIALVAVYEDSVSSSRYTDSFAIQGKVKGRWHILGYRVHNRSPYNLIAFKPREVEAIRYFWTKSADNHVRIMEIEAYSGSEDLGDIL